MSTHKKLDRQDHIRRSILSNRIRRNLKFFISLKKNKQQTNEPNNEPPSADAAAMFRPGTSSLFSLEVRESQWTVKGVLNDEFRAASTIELNIVMIFYNIKLKLPW